MKELLQGYKEYVESMERCNEKHDLNDEPLSIGDWLEQEADWYLRGQSEYND